MKVFAFGIALLSTAVTAENVEERRLGVIPAPGIPGEMDTMEGLGEEPYECIPGKHWLVCGDPDRTGAAGCKDSNGDFHTTFQAFDTEEHEVRCCTDNKDLPQRLSSGKYCPGIYGISELNGTCVHGANYTAASEMCTSIGARLCTQVEIANGCTERSGCSHDDDWVWTSTPVGVDLEIPESNGFHYAACGHPTRFSAEDCQREGVFVPNMRASDEEKHEVRCCSEDKLPFFVSSREKKNNGCSVYGISELPIVANSTFGVQCYEAKTHWEAETICASNGARLCTDFEIAKGCTRGSGCGFDNHMVWTRDPACATPELCALEWHEDERMGCFSDSNSAPQLAFHFGKYFSIDRCFASCKDAGYAYAGLKKGDECYCGDRMDSGREVADEQCALPCLLGSGGMCGGKNAVTIFETGVPPSEESNYEENYMGCFNDKEKSLTEMVSSAASIRECVDLCSAGTNFAIASLQEGGKCYCTLNKINAKSSDCTARCAKGKGLCGGVKGRSLYKTTNGIKPLEGLGLCKGAKSSWWGDPHMITFDGLSYNCQGVGHFVITQCPNYELQAMFKPATTTTKHKASASVTDGIAAKYKNYPKVQISIADYESDYSEVINSCPVHVYVGGVLVNQTLTMSDKIDITPVSNGFTIQFPDHGPHLRVKVRKGRGCLVDVDTCIPEVCMPDAVGLLGTPNGDRDDEWMFRNGTTYWPRPNNFKGQGGFDYCTQHWCVTKPSDSLFTYGGGKGFDDYDECAADFQGEIDTSGLTEDQLTACAQSANPDQCHIEAAIGGDAAVDETLDNDHDVDLDDDPDPDDPTNPGCPKDVELVSSTGPMFDNWPVSVAGWGEGTVTLEITTPLSHLAIGKYLHVQYPEHSGTTDVCVSHHNFDKTLHATINVQCMHSTPFALIHLYVSDTAAYQERLAPDFVGTDIDECCHPPEGALGEVTIEYTFLVSCVQRCPVDTE